MTDCILAIDIGTLQVKAVLVNLENGSLVNTASHSHSLEFPRPGYVEQDPQQIWNSIKESTHAVIQKTSVNVKALTFCAQMTGIIPLDSSGRPLMNFLTWLDTRAAPLVPEMFPGIIRLKGYGLWRLLKFLRITGGAPSFTGKDVISKHYWLKSRQPDIYNQTIKILDTKDYAIYRTTGNYVTSSDLAAITWLMDTRPGRQSWSEEIFDLLQLDITKMPEIESTTSTVGNLTSKAAKELKLPREIPVVNGTGDMMAAAIGSGAISDGDLHASLGTAGWVACHCSERCRDLGTYTGAVCSANSERFLILCKQETSGGALEWVKDLLFDQPNNSIWAKIDEQVHQIRPGAEDLFFLPWLMGERAPIDDHSMRGVFFNLSLHHSRNQMLRATFEGIGLNLRWALEAVEKVRAKKIKTPADKLRLIGGGARSNTWTQIITDILNKEIERRTRPQDAAAHGVALTAMVGLGILPSFESIIPLIKVDQVFYPNQENVEIYSRKFKIFKEIYKRTTKLHARLNA